MNTKHFLIAVAAASLLFAGFTGLSAQSATGGINGFLTDVNVEAGARTEVIYVAHGGSASNFRPWPVDGDWKFNWTNSRVEFEGSFVFGDYQTITDAGSMGGVTHQIFYDFAHHVEGTGEWNPSTGTMTFEIPIAERDDSRASTITQSRDPECRKISGMFAGTACKAFEDSSPGLEGLLLTIQFNDEKTSFSGEAVMIQYGGSGATKSETTLQVEFDGSLD